MPREAHIEAALGEHTIVWIFAFMNRQVIWAFFIVGLLLPTSAGAAVIAHAFTEVNTQQTTVSTSYVDITGAAITSGNFTAGKKYLLVISAQLGDTVGNKRDYIRALHGTTVFAESEMIIRDVNAAQRTVYGWMTVWTAVSGEGIKLQFATAAAGTATADYITLLAINLSDDVTENTDWFFAESATNLGLTTTFQDGGAITFTPGTASHDWLVLSYAQSVVTAGGPFPISRLDRSGEATSSLPEARRQPIGTAEINGYPLARVFTLAAASNTFKEQSALDTGTSGTRLHSAIFALNLNKFRNHAFAYTEADSALSATDYATQLQTLSVTPDVISDVWVGAYWGFDRNASAREAEFRVQLDNSDQPAGQTTSNLQFAGGNDGAADEHPMILHTMPNLSAAAHTIDLDASSDSATGAPAGQQMTLWAVTMELAAAGAAAPQRMLLGVGQ